jgi:hypothetical protein
MRVCLARPRHILLLTAAVATELTLLPLASPAYCSGLRGNFQYGNLTPRSIT